MVRAKLCVRTVPTDRRLRPGRGPPGRDARAITQREEQVFQCSLIYKLPVLWMPGASARYSCLRTPVETSTSPHSSEETRSIPFPRLCEEARKLHIRSFLLPLKIEGQAFDFVSDNDSLGPVAARGATTQTDEFGFPLKNERQAFVFVKNSDGWEKLSIRILDTRH